MSFCSFVFRGVVDFKELLRDQQVEYMETYCDTDANMLCCIVFSGAFNLETIRLRLKEQLKLDLCVTVGITNMCMDDCHIVKTIKRHRGSKCYKRYNGFAVHLERQRREFEKLAGTMPAKTFVPEDEWMMFLADDIRSQLLEGGSAKGCAP